MTHVSIPCMAAVLLAVAAAPAHAQECTPRPSFSVRAPAVVLATAGADTVLAGPGPFRYEGDTTRLSRIHGMRVRVEGIAGDVPAELAAGGTDAVLVPYHCRFGSARTNGRGRWVEPGTRLFVGASLRPRERWAGGLPTFDVDLVLDHYPQGYVQRNVPNEPRLSPGEMFEFSRALPAREQARAAPEAAYAQVVAWARANPALAERFPAVQALDEVREALHPCVAAFGVHPVAGTYRVTLRVDGAATQNFYLRTQGRGEAHCGPAPRDADLGAPRPRTADTTYLFAHGARREADLPEGGYDSARDCGGNAFQGVNAAGRGRGRWEGDLFYLVLSACLPDQPRVGETVLALMRADAARDPAAERGEFRALAGGGMQFRQEWRLDGGVVLEVTAVRVSRRTLADD